MGKNRTSMSQPVSGRLKSPGSRTPLGVSPTGCQYPGIGQNSSHYSQGSSPPCEQVYYPHHTPNMANMANMAAMGMANPGLLQPVSSSATGLSLSHMSQSMQACQLAGQNNACALASSSGNGSGYGGLSGQPPQAHASLPSCTYMQSNQTAYPGHLPSNMSVMNIATSTHFPGPMAWHRDVEWMKKILNRKTIVVR